MKVFVTGCAGFIGSHITDTLAELCISRGELGWSPKGPIDKGIHSFLGWYKQYVAKDTYIVQKN